ncbi:hypothetical protein BDAP_002188 [Binucleata daphniae]
MNQNTDMMSNIEFRSVKNMIKMIEGRSSVLQQQDVGVNNALDNRNDASSSIKSRIALFEQMIKTNVSANQISANSKVKECGEKIIQPKNSIDTKENDKLPNKKKDEQILTKEKELVKYVARRQAKKSGVKTKNAQAIKTLNVEKTKEKNVYLEVYEKIKNILDTNKNKCNLILHKLVKDTAAIIDLFKSRVAIDVIAIHIIENMMRDIVGNNSINNKKKTDSAQNIKTNNIDNISAKNTALKQGEKAQASDVVLVKTTKNNINSVA